MRSFLYVSYNIVAGVPILAILGGSDRVEKTAVWGGLIGGAALGTLMLVMSAGLLSHLDSIADLPMPMLSIANEISPLLGMVMCLVIFGMVGNTAVGTMFSFLARLMPAGTSQFRWGSLATGIVAFVFSLVGFIHLVGEVYPFFDYLGFVLMAAVLLGWIRRGRQAQSFRVRDRANDINQWIGLGRRPQALSW
ncbi:hypothetical protein PshuTeo1_54170 [Pseudomonas hunanensis]|nr:hypothetical protein PshuTeo1_54170 [Pseudomonas hunanensis]